jgi:HAD superfamily hydrolase (TIGR01459 family)
MTDIVCIDSIAPLASSTGVWFVDIWGVLHNGVAPFAPAVDACIAFRTDGGRVILVSNSPRLAAGVQAQLDSIGVARAAYDRIITSGDVSRALVAKWAGKTVVHIGPVRDRAIFEGLGVNLGNAAESACAVCTGLFDDERETPDDYSALLTDLHRRAVPMICANPDKTVLRGGRTIYCAGAIAATYEALGGHVSYAGKPFAPIYEVAFGIAETLCGVPVEKSRVLAIGDGIATDIEGASRAGIRSVFIASGLHGPASGDLAASVDGLFSEAAIKPVAAMRGLAW